MKKRCKNIDIRNPETVYPWVLDCIERHYKRHDFRKMLCTIGGMGHAEYQAMCDTHNKAALQDPAQKIAEEACRQIATHDLQLGTIKYTRRTDGSSGKVRLIGNESAMQQIMDYIAVYSCKEILDIRISKFQASSAPGRGQVYGTRNIQKWIKKDNDSIRYAEKHHLQYTPKCKYSTKLDVKGCFEHGRVEVFMKFFRRDCANKDILWLWEALLTSHRTDEYKGFMIGALVSQYATRYLISFAYRQVMGQHYTKGGRKFQRVQHCLIYMDDILLLGGNKCELQRAAKTLTHWMKRELKFELKQKQTVMEVSKSPIDMMGYVTHTSNKVSIRSRVFVRLRRMALRFMRNRHMNLKQARRALSYKGFVINRKIRLSPSKILHRYHLRRLFEVAAKVVSRSAKYGKSNLQYATVGNSVYAVA